MWYVLCNMGRFGLRVSVCEREVHALSKTLPMFYIGSHSGAYIVSQSVSQSVSKSVGRSVGRSVS